MRCVALSPGPQPLAPMLTPPPRRRAPLLAQWPCLQARRFLRWRACMTNPSSPPYAYYSDWRASRREDPPADEPLAACSMAYAKDGAKAAAVRSLRAHAWIRNGLPVVSLMEALDRAYGGAAGRQGRRAGGSTASWGVVLATTAPPARERLWCSRCTRRRRSSRSARPAPRRGPMPGGAARGVDATAVQRYCGSRTWRRRQGRGRSAHRRRDCRPSTARSRWCGSTRRWPRRRGDGRPASLSAPWQPAPSARCLLRGPWQGRRVAARTNSLLWPALPNRRSPSALREPAPRSAALPSRVERRLWRLVPVPRDAPAAPAASAASGAPAPKLRSGGDRQTRVSRSGSRRSSPARRIDSNAASTTRRRVACRPTSRLPGGFSQGSGPAACAASSTPGCITLALRRKPGVPLERRTHQDSRRLPPSVHHRRGPAPPTRLRASPPAGFSFLPARGIQAELPAGPLLPDVRAGGEGSGHSELGRVSCGSPARSWFWGLPSARRRAGASRLAGPKTVGKNHAPSFALTCQGPGRGSSRAQPETGSTTLFRT